MDYITPPVCPFCREDVFPGEDGHLCRSCEEKMPTLPERCCSGCGGANSGALELCPACLRTGKPRPWLNAVSAFPFYGSARLAIHEYKYRKRVSLGPYLGRSMYEAWVARGGGVKADLISYIPLFFTRYVWRGYNQSAILAEIVGRKLEVPVKRVLYRCRNTAQQARLKMGKRLENMCSAFKLFFPGRVRGKHILLVDDVFTTGATLTAATELLLGAGASGVSVLTAARD